MATKDDVDKVLIKSDNSISGCNSPLGKQNGTQIIYLNEQNCFTVIIIAHELYHSIGFYHEHARRDRDEYIEVREKCIKYGAEDQFRIYPNALSYGLPYNPKSIMHYPSLAFNNGECAPIISKVMQ